MRRRICLCGLMILGLLWLGGCGGQQGSAGLTIALGAAQGALQPMTIELVRGLDDDELTDLGEILPEIGEVVGRVDAIVQAEIDYRQLPRAK